jgi:hypothetical protein
MRGRGSHTAVCGVFADEPSQLFDRLRRRPDVSSREQRFAPIERQVGARRISVIESIERPPEQVRGDRHVVARQRPPARCGEMTRRPLAERPALRIDRPELAEELVRLLEMPADRLVVLDRLGGARFDPVGKAAVQLRARPLEQAPVGRVADQHVVEAQHRLAEEPAAVRLDQLAAPQRLDPRVQVGGFAWQQRSNRVAGEVAADHRGTLENGTIFRTQPLDAGREQRVNRGRHLEGRETDTRDPPIALLP